MPGHGLPSPLRVVQEERSQCLWAALEKIIPDVRLRAELALVGTPLTHERFLRRYKGTYGELSVPQLVCQWLGWHLPG